MSDDDNILWPRIDDAESARRAVKSSVVASVLIATLTIVLVVSSLGLPLEASVSRSWAIVTAAVWVVIALGFRSMSRVAAVAALILFVWTSVSIDLATWIFILPAMIFVNGARATFRFHKYRKEPAPTP